MAFYARDFVFDGKPSQQYGLTITSENAESSTNASSDVDIITQKIFRRPRLYLLGVDQTPVLQFPISFNSEKPINALLATNIANNLFGQMGYKKLQVLAPDYDGYYWNCYLKNPQQKRVGGEIVGWNCDVVCDSPWAYSFPKTLSYTYTPPISNINLLYNNRSGNNDYSCPSMSFTMANTGGSFSITNTTDNSRVFSFTTLSANEVITIDNDLQILTSSLGLLRLSHFNKKWFRLVPGRNDLIISGNITALSFTQTNAQKIGG